MLRLKRPRCHTASVVFVFPENPGSTEFPAEGHLWVLHSLASKFEKQETKVEILACGN